MVTLITILHAIVCVFLILVVLLQAGKGGGVGVAFGSSTSAQVFGGRGAGSFLERLTAGTAIVFMLTSMTLAYFASRSDSPRLQKLTAERAAKQKASDEKAADEKAAKDAAERAKGLPAAASESSSPPLPGKAATTSPTQSAAPAEKGASEAPGSKPAPPPHATPTTPTSTSAPTDRPRSGN
jgi:preprotein translocase subunit SecG